MHSYFIIQYLYSDPYQSSGVLEINPRFLAKNNLDFSDSSTGIHVYMGTHIYIDLGFMSFATMWWRCLDRLNHTLPVFYSFPRFSPPKSWELPTTSSVVFHDSQYSTPNHSPTWNQPGRNSSNLQVCATNMADFFPRIVNFEGSAVGVHLPLASPSLSSNNRLVNS